MSQTARRRTAARGRARSRDRASALRDGRSRRNRTAADGPPGSVRGTTLASPGASLPGGRPGVADGVDAGTAGDLEGVEVLPPATSATLAEATVQLAADRPQLAYRVGVLSWSLLVALGALLLVAALSDVGPSWLDGAGAIAVATAYTWGLAARTGGRPVVFGALALAVGAVAVVSDQSVLRTGAAVFTCVISAVLAVMLTRPAVRLVRAAAECVLAIGVAAVGALATIGFSPVVSVARFEYVTLALAVLGAFGVVYRLGAGLHGLGRRGVGGVLAGGVLLAVTVLYAELLRHYGPPDVVHHLLDEVGWVRQHLGAFPRPIEAVLGVPALAWGCHMRARRRQGWWLCAFGVAATAPVANCLVNPSVSLQEGGLSVLYGLVVGLVIGAVVIRLDLAVTGSRDRGSRRLEEQTAVRPEPPRTQPLL